MYQSKVFVVFEVLTEVRMEISIFWNITRCSQLKTANVSEEHVACILWVEDELVEVSRTKSWNSDRSGRAVIEVLTQNLPEQEITKKKKPQ